MYRLLLIPLLFLPLSAGAAAYAPDVPQAGSTSTATNTYSAASDVTVAQPLPADLITAGARVDVRAPVSGDILAAAGTLMVEQGAGGDVRVAGGRVTIEGPVAGDVAAAGAKVNIVGTAHNVYAAGGSVTVSGGSTGDVTIYGGNVTISGTYAGNVAVVASNHFVIADGTHIRGVLKYSAPEALSIPQGVTIDGGARYTGAYAYVPTNRQAHQYAVLGSGIFFLVRILAGVIVAGLVAGLFPIFSKRIADAIVRKGQYAPAKLAGLGLLLAAGTPIFVVLLTISFVGAELAIGIGMLYVLLALLSYTFTGIVAGVLLRRHVWNRLGGGNELLWQDAAAGTVLVHVLGLIPVLGTVLILLFTVTCAGALARFAYREAFAYH